MFIQVYQKVIGKMGETEMVRNRMRASHRNCSVEKLQYNAIKSIEKW